MYKSLVFVVCMASVVVICGCQDTDTKKVTNGDKGGGHEGHDHAAKGPHGGAILELGKEEYHAEWTFDAASGKINVYILDKDMKNEVPIAAETITIETLLTDGDKKTHKLAGVGITEESPKTAQFQATDKALLELLKMVGHAVTATIEVEVTEGKTVSGKFEHDEAHH